MVKRQCRSGTWELRSPKCCVDAMSRSSNNTVKWRWDRSGMRSRECFYSKKELGRNSLKFSKGWDILIQLHASKSGSNTLSLRVRKIRGQGNTVPNRLVWFSIDLWNVDKLMLFTSWGTEPKRKILRRSILDGCWCTAVLIAWDTISADGTTKKSATISQTQSM